MAYQILNPGMRLWFSKDGEAVVGYVTANNYRIVGGAPVCAPERLAQIGAELSADTRRARQRLCYFGAQGRLMDQLVPRGEGSALLLGAQPVWDPRHWSAILAGKASLRAQLSRARNKGVEVRPLREDIEAHRPDLQRCLDEWLGTRGLPPMHFLVEWNILPRLLDRRLFVAERDGETIGFLIASPVPARNGWLIEQIIRGHAAPNGTTELLLDTAICSLAEEGAEYVTLGLSPLSRAVPQEPVPPWTLRLLLAWVRVHGKRFYRFEGLEHFKRKFLPEEWEPIYAITRPSSDLPAGALRHRRRLRGNVAGPVHRPRAAASGGSGGAVDGGQGAALMGQKQPDPIRNLVDPAENLVDPGQNLVDTDQNLLDPGRNLANPNLDLRLSS